MKECRKNRLNIYFDHFYEYPQHTNRYMFNSANHLPEESEETLEDSTIIAMGGRDFLESKFATEFAKSYQTSHKILRKLDVSSET